MMTIILSFYMLQFKLISSTCLLSNLNEINSRQARAEPIPSNT